MAQFTEIGVEAVVKGYKKFMSNLGSMGKGVAGVGVKAAKFAAAGVAATGAAIAGLGAISIKTAIDFESAWTGVTKTTDDLVDEMGQLTEEGAKIQQGFRDLAGEVPIAVEELMAIGELGGQLGIAKEDLLGFTETIAAMGESTNLTTEAAAEQMAKFANIMGTTADFGVEGYERMGSTVVQLGNTMATTERDILSFGQRIAGAGEIAGLSEAEVLGIGAAFSSVGIEAEAGGTAVQKVLLAMNQAAIEGGDSLELFAATAGYESSEAFQEAWSDVPGEVFQDFVTGLGAAGDDAMFILGELELQDQRLIRSFLSLAGSSEVLDKALMEANTGWQRNTALQEEANKRYATTAKRLQLLKNRVKDVAISIGLKLLPVVNKAVDFLMGFGDVLQGVLSGKGIEVTELKKKFGKDVVGAMLKVARFIKNKLIPGIRSVAEWLRKNIPIAAKAAIKFIGRIVSWVKNFIKYIGFVVEEGDTLNDYLAKFPEKARPFIKAIGEIVNWLKENIPKAIEAARRFFADVLLPAIRRVINWLSAYLPIAIEAVKQGISALAAFWRDTLLPALTQVVGFVRDNLVPILSGIAVLIMTIVIPAVVAWAAANVAAAIATIVAWAPVIAAALALVAVVAVLVKAWQKDWGGIQTKTKEVWEKTLKPAFEGIKEWLSVNIPKAIETVKKFWENTLKPALEAVGSFISTEVIPRLEDLVEWLKVNIPKAMETVKQFWDTVLKPALEALWKFIQDPVLVWIGKLFDWLSIKIPEGFEAVKSFWDSVLQPALQAITDFIEDPLLVKIRELVSWVGEKIQEAWETIKSWWEGDGTGFIQDIVDWIQDPLIVKIEELIAWVLDIMTLGFKVLVKWWQNNGERLITWIAGGFGKIKGVIDSIIKAIGALIRKAGEIKDSLPDWLIPGSPTPLELGLVGVADALKVANAEFGQLASKLYNLPKPSLVVAGTGQQAAPLAALPSRAAAGGAVGRTTSITLAPTINNGMDLAVFEARVKSIVTKATGE